MVQKAITFVHLTDLHVSAPPAGAKPPDAETLARLDTVLEMIRSIDPAPEFIAVSGDVTDKGDEASYRIVRDRMQALGIPVVYALGNHDSRPDFYGAMLDRSEDPDAPYNHEQTIAGVHVVVLDTSVPGRTSGALDDAQFAFLDESLRKEPDLPKIVLMHHAPRIDGDSSYAWESLNEAETARFAAMVKGRNVAAILTGHIHHDRFSSWHGIPLVVGNGLQNHIDPLFDAGLRIVTGASFSLCTLRDWGLTVSVVPLAATRETIATIDDAKVRSFR